MKELLAFHSCCGGVEGGLLNEVTLGRLTTSQGRTHTQKKLSNRNWTLGCFGEG